MTPTRLILLIILCVLFSGCSKENDYNRGYKLGYKTQKEMLTKQWREHH